MKLIKTKVSLLVSVFLFAVVVLPVNVSAQSSGNSAETAFDYVQMKRSVANQISGKRNPAPPELDWAIKMLNELLVYLDKPEIRSFAETFQSLKSQRADVRYDLAKALMKAGRKADVIKIIGELADEGMSSVYADWLESVFFRVSKHRPKSRILRAAKMRF